MPAGSLLQHFFAFKGARDEWLERSIELLTRSFLGLAAILIPLQIYRNFLAEPTPWAIPILVCALVITALCVPWTRLRPRIRLGAIAITLMLYGLFVQMRNIDAPLSNFHIISAALTGILIILGTRAAFLGLALFMLSQTILLLLFSDDSVPRIASLMVGYSSVTAITLGFLATLLQTYQDAENKLRQTQKQLVTSQKQRNKLLESITSELAVPLSGLEALALHSDLPTGIAKDLRTLNGDISESIEDLRHHLWPDSVTKTIRESDCNVIELMAAVRRQVEPLFASEHIQLEMRRVRIPAPFYRLDSSKLRAAITAVLRNIPQHSGAKHATLSLTAKPIGDLSRLSITITDDGCGLPADMARALASFSHDDADNLEHGSELKRVQIWLGLIGGRLRYQPHSPSGAKFELEIHVAPAELGQHEIERTLKLDTTAASGLRIAIVDEDVLLARAAGALVKSLGIKTVDIYASANELQGSVRNGRFYNLILIDQYLDGENGAALIPKLQSLGSTGPFIMMNATPTADTRSANLAAGAATTAQKPLTATTLMPALEEAIPHLTKARAHILASYL